MLRLATPVIVVQVGMVLMGAVDTMMLGRVSATDLAAGAIGNALSVAVIWSFIGILLAIDPMRRRRSAPATTGESAACSAGASAWRSCWRCRPL